MIGDSRDPSLRRERTSRPVIEKRKNNQETEKEHSVVQLGKRIKTRHLFSLAFGCIIGVGWMVVLGDWLRLAGPLGTLLACAGGTLVIIVVGLCYAELATMFPVSGGEVAYAYEIYGTKTSFTLGWFLAFPYVATISFEAIAAAWLLNTLFPGIEGAVLYTIQGEAIRLGSLILGLCGTIFLTRINYRGLKSAAVLQEIFTYGLLILSFVFIFAGLFWGKTSNLQPLFSESQTGPIFGGIFAVFVMMPFFFGGFNVIPQVMEEKSPGTSLRSAGNVILLSICAASVFYLLVILSSSMATSWKQLLTMELPAAGAFEAAFRSSLMARIVLLAGLCGIITTWNTVFISSSRIIFSLGRGRIIPSAFGKVHPVFGSPYVSIVFVGAIGSFGVFLGRSAIVTIINVSGVCFGLSFLLICLGVVKLKRSKPLQHRPYSVPGGLPTAVFGVISAFFILFLALYQPYVRSGGSFPMEWAILLGWGLIGVLFWIFARKIRNQVSEKQRRELILGAGVPFVESEEGSNQTSPDASSLLQGNKKVLRERKKP